MAEARVSISTGYHPAQQIVVDDPARFKILVAGRRFGKSRLATTECLKVGLAGGNAWWVAPDTNYAAPGWELLRKKGSQMKGVCEVRLADRELRFASGGIIKVRTTHDPRHGLRGTGLDFVVMDECAFSRPTAWTEEIRPSLMDKLGGAMFISTPKGHNWFYDLWQAAEGKSDWARWQFPTSANPHIRPEEIVEAREELGGLLSSQELDAEFITAGGDVFKATWFAYYTSAIRDDGVRFLVTPDGTRVDLRECQRFGVVDLAASMRESADYTVIMSVAVHGRFVFVLDVVRKRMEAPDTLPAVWDAIRKHDLGVVWFEKAGYQLSMIQAARREGMPVQELSADKDKLARALPAAARMEAGQVLLPAEAEWLDAFRTEVAGFPAAKHDDQVDALAYAVRVAGQQGRKRPGLEGLADFGVRASPNRPS